MYFKYDHPIELQFLIWDVSGMFVVLVHSQGILGPGKKSGIMISIFVASQAVPGPVTGWQNLAAFHRGQKWP